jgi:hypothetical protein
VQAPGTKLEEPITTAKIETFDGFHYELKIGKPAGESYPVVVNVSGTFAKERTPGKDEKPEDKKKLDDEFAAKVKGFEEKLASEKKLEGRPYLVAKFAVDPLLQARDTLLAPKPPEPPKPAEQPKPVELPKPAPQPELPKPAESPKPPEPPKPADAPKPELPKPESPKPESPKPAEPASPEQPPKPPTPDAAPPAPSPAPDSAEQPK